MAYKTGNGRGAELETFWLIHKKTPPKPELCQALRAVNPFSICNKTGAGRHPRSGQGFLPAPITPSFFLALPKGTPLWNPQTGGFGGVQLSPITPAPHTLRQRLKAFCEATHLSLRFSIRQLHRSSVLRHRRCRYTRTGHRPRWLRER